MKLANYIFFILISVACISCKQDKTPIPEEVPVDCVSGDVDANSDIIGYGIMDKLPGIWNGPVYSPTPLGSFSEWIVDLRPISSSQISAKNELDSINDIFMSFFVVKHDCQYKIAFRNGGGFGGQVRSSYMIIDSVNEGASQQYYRFVDPVSGGNRVYTEVIFKQDSLIMHTYTNQYNTLQDPVTHMIWRADHRNSAAMQNALTEFNYPQKELTKDFSNTFDSLTEAVFYTGQPDPYPEQDQPYVGETNVSINISSPATIDPAKKVLIIITTEPLFNGFVFQPASLDTRSRYVFVGADTPTGYDFNYMHPGDYFVNAIYDENGDYSFSSGDYMNSNFDVPVTLSPNGTANATINIDFLIP
jgi:hypothetical protein